MLIVLSVDVMDVAGEQVFFFFFFVQIIYEYYVFFNINLKYLL